VNIHLNGWDLVVAGLELGQCVDDRREIGVVIGVGDFRSTMPK
jgi:hypothetical protein